MCCDCDNTSATCFHVYTYPLLSPLRRTRTCSIRQANTTEKHYREAAEKNEELLRQLGRRDGEVSELTARCETLTLQKAGLQTQVDAFTAEMAAAAADNAAAVAELEGQLTAKDSEIDSLQRQLEHAEAESGALKDQLVIAHAKIDVLQMQLDHRAASPASVHRSGGSQTRSADSGKLQSQLDALQQRCVALMQQALKAKEQVKMELGMEGEAEEIGGDTSQLLACGGRDQQDAADEVEQQSAHTPLREVAE